MEYKGKAYWNETDTNADVNTETTFKRVPLILFGGAAVLGICAYAVYVTQVLYYIFIGFAAFIAAFIIILTTIKKGKESVIKREYDATINIDLGTGEFRVSHGKKDIDFKDISFLVEYKEGSTTCNIQTAHDNIVKFIPELVKGDFYHLTVECDNTFIEAIRKRKGVFFI